QGENEKISTRYFYDKCGFLAMEVDALGGTTRYEYTPDGRLCTEINKGGDVTEYEYDPIGLLTKTKYSDGQEVMFSYDPLRQLAEMKDALGLTKIKTDAIGRITEVTDPENRTIRYSWTPTGERESITYPDGSVVRYNHDPMGRISQVIDGQETVATYRYDAAGHILERMLPNGVKTEYVYSELGAMKNLIHSDQTGQLDAFSYRYDPVGNKTEIHRTRRLPDGTDETIVSGYVYDQMNRLTEVIKDGAPLRSYGYDALGNRTMRRDAQIGAQTNYRVPDIRFAFDAANRIVAAATASGDTAAYTYDGFGRRVKSVWDKAAVSEREAWHEEQRYILDALKPYENVLMTYSGSGSVRYVWGNELISADTVGVDPTYYLHDELRSLVRTVDVDGGSLSRFDYDEFGVHMPGAQDGFATGGEPFSEELFGFTGYQLDPITGLYYAQARYYMPQAGRFMSADPIKFGNPYTYCYNNPLSFIDPSGLTALKDPKAGPFSITDPDDPKDPYAPYYGGNQAWYPEDWENKSACGPTAAANTLSYLAVTNPDDSALYGYSDFTKKNYTQFMTDVIQDVTPIHFYVPIPIGTQSLIPVYKPKEMSFGVPTLTQYINGVTKYAADKGVTLTATSTSNITMSYSDAVSFIENGLDKNSPVSLLMYTNSDSALSQYQWHWMTITDISYSEKDADYIVTVSSWGQSYKLPLRDIWTKSSYTGLAYFQNTGGCIDD
ncbi:MAG: hypothetical protein FWF33_05835, partial [Clostridiales bacterium]|nr:hypothetical protein [Clostridiales bacterium]